MQAACPCSKPLFSVKVVRGAKCFGQAQSVPHGGIRNRSRVLVPPGSADSSQRQPDGLQHPCTKQDLGGEPSAKNPPLLNSDSSQTSPAPNGQQVVKKYQHILCGLLPQTGDFPHNLLVIHKPQRLALQMFI